MCQPISKMFVALFTTNQVLIIVKKMFCLPLNKLKIITKISFSEVKKKQQQRISNFKSFQVTAFEALTLFGIYKFGVKGINDHKQSLMKKCWGKILFKILYLELKAM